MLLISPENKYPRYIGDLLIENPSFVQGDKLPDGWHEVSTTDLPELGVDETFEEVFPVADESGNFIQTFQVRPMTAEEIERRDAPKTARAKLIALGLTELEIDALTRGLVR